MKKVADDSIPKAMQAGVVVENGTIYREIVEAAKDLDIHGADDKSWVPANYRSTGADLRNARARKR